MGNKLTAAVSIAALVAGMSLSAFAADQAKTIFNTKDYRQDRALWTTPEYWRFNTPGQMGGMALNIVSYETTGQVGGARLYGSKGTGVPGKTNLASPYPFKTAMEQYNAWLKAANGGTKHTKVDVPDWSGLWTGGGGGGGGPVSDVVKFLKPKYQQYYVQEVKASAEARTWGAGSVCLPGGFFSALNPFEFIVTPNEVWTHANSYVQNTTRWIYVNAQHTPENLQYPKWMGESIGFWDKDALIVHTNQIKGWRGGPGGETTDNVETVEKYQRVGDTIQGEMTIYDPDVFTGPVYQKMNFRLNKNPKPTDRPIYNTCTDTQGPSPRVFLNANGFEDEHVTGDPGFTWDTADPRPWGTWADASDQRYMAYLAKGGKPPVSADVTPPPAYKNGTGAPETAAAAKGGAGGD